MGTLVTLRRILFAAIVAALAVPGTSLAVDATITPVDVPLAGERTTAASGGKRFTLVGIHWRGSGAVSFRTRSLAGTWSPWRPAAPEEEDRPDRSSAETGRRSSWHLGNPWWTGPSDRIEYRTRGQVTRLRAWLVWSPAGEAPERSLAVATAPTIVPRADWKADERIVRQTPSYADRIRLSVVHHTAGQNVYTPAEAPAIVKAIQLYHVQGNGWNDIGYNFLVDRYGVVYEGRGGGVDRNVIGAHAQGFNTGSVGVAVLGTYGSGAPTVAAQDALQRLLAWRLDVAHVDPLSTFTYVSNGSNKFPSGIPVFMRAVSGHRDTGFTSCPGDALYARLPTIAGAVSKIGLPKLYEPVVTGKVGSAVRIRARLSGSLSWRLTVTDELGITASSTSGVGSVVDWIWDATLSAPGLYTWKIETAAGVELANGRIGSLLVTPTLALSAVALDPETVSPNDDGDADVTTLTYRLTAPATVTVQAIDELGIPILDLAPAARKPAGEQAVEIDPSPLADGPYRVLVTARDALGVEVSRTTGLFVTRTLGFGVVTPLAFSPNADGRADRLALRFTLNGAANVRVRIVRDGRWIATPFEGPLLSGRRLVTWDGAKRVGRLRDGDYAAIVEATDTVGVARMTLPFASDTVAPRVRFLPGLPVRLRVSEPARLTLRVNGVARKLDVEAAGDVVVAKRGRVRVVAWDAAGNRSAPALRG